MRAQSPEKMSYQAVLRNISNQLITNSEIGMRISILKGTINGTIVYKEIYNPNPQTDANGLVGIEIGGGIPLTGIFSAINWSNGPYFIKTETDPTGGTNYTITGTSQILSVPYAMYSKIAANSFSGIYDDLTGKPDFLKWDKDSTNDVTILGPQTIEGNKTFSNTIISNDGINANNKSITNLASPINAQDLVTKAYVDDLTLQLYEQGNLKVKDVDGNLYKVVIIGSQVWIAENLKTSKYNDGMTISLDTDNAVWMHNIEGAYCWYNNNEGVYKNTYGALYNWYAINTGKLCPAGWHVPSYDEWSTLNDYLDDTITGCKLKETGTTHWISPNTGATNESGFTALPGGIRASAGSFYLIGDSGYWWSSAEIDDPWAYYLSYENCTISITSGNKAAGYSVRCLKN